MDKLINVLVFPAGEINAVELHDALSTAVNIKVIGASSVERHGAYIFKNYIPDLPLITDPKFFEVFNTMLAEHHIDVIFTTHDTVTTFFGDNQDRIKAKVIGADRQTAEVCRDKQKIYDLFKDCEFVPKQHKTVDEHSPFPLFIKPRVGAGSVGALKITSAREVQDLDLGEYVVNEFLPGDEYTVDCLTDKNRKLVLVSPRSRDRTLAGVSVAGRTQPLTSEIEAMAQTINDRLVFEGLWFFQIKKDGHGRFKLLEVSTRCAGTMCLTRARGANLPLLSVYVALGYDVAPVLNDYEVVVDRTLISRYKITYEYDTVYLDFDDTVIVRGRVHPYAAMFIYQCQNQGKKLYLLTRHEKDINKTLAQYKIDPSLFVGVLHLQQLEQKTHHIKPEGAIFIDNAFQERKLVHDKHHIPVFDVDGLEVLLDWRT